MTSASSTNGGFAYCLCLRVIAVLALAEIGARLILDGWSHVPPSWPRFLLNIVLAVLFAAPYLYHLNKRERRLRLDAEEESRRQTQSQAALYRIARLSFMDMTLDEAMGGVLDCLFSVSWLGLNPSGAIFLTDERKDQLILHSFRGDALDLDVCAGLNFGECLCGRAAQSKSVVFGGTDDFDHMHRHPVVSAHRHYCVPIIRGERCLGVIEVQMSAGHQRDEREIDFLSAVADLVALVLARKDAEEHLKRLATAIEQAAETVIITDPKGSIQYVNPAFTTLTGYFREEALGQNPRMLKSGKQNQEFYEALWRRIGSGHVWDGRMTNRKKDGTLYDADTCITPVKGDLGRIVNHVAVCRDVTVMAALEEKLRRSQKMEAVGLLAEGIAHDFNNVLTTIIGYNYFILEGLETGHPLRAFSLELRRSAELAGSLTHQLMALGRHQVVKPRIMDPNTVIIAMTKMLRRLVGDDIEVTLETHPALWPVKMDNGQLEQIVLNLAVNARDAMPKGGRLTLTTKNLSAHDNHSPDPVMSLPQGQYICLEVRDTGMGMDESTKEHLFQPFFTTKEAGRGTGLGLATVLGIVQHYQGHISVESTPGHGSVFRVYLPHAEGGIEAMLPGDISKTSRGGRETIMVVEDNDALRTIIKRALREKGYRIFSARSSEEALEHCRKLKEHIDLLLTDIILPDFDGPELARRLIGSRQDLRVIFMSGYPAGSRGELSNAQDVVHIEKPFSPEELLGAVRRVLDDTKVEAV